MLKWKSSEAAPPGKRKRFSPAASTIDCVCDVVNWSSQYARFTPTRLVEAGSIVEAMLTVVDRGAGNALMPKYCRFMAGWNAYAAPEGSWVEENVPVWLA